MALVARICHGCLTYVVNDSEAGCAVANETSYAFEAMADPTRRKILMLLSEGEMSATAIADDIDYIGRSAVSNHLRILRSSGLVSERRQGRFRFYSVNETAAEDVVTFVASVYRSAFADLKTATESAARDSRELPSDSRASSAETG